MLHGKKIRSEAVEKVQKTGDMDCSESAVDSPSLHKDDLLDDEDNEMSDNESLATQPEEVSIHFLAFNLSYFRSKFI